MKRKTLLFLFSVFLCGCVHKMNVNSELDYCTQKIQKNLPALTNYHQMPRSISKDKQDWNTVPIEDWTSGFWPGVLWYTFEYSQDENIRQKADSFSRSLTPLAYRKAFDHDLGFMMFCSFGNGYRLTKDQEYKRILLATADTLATLFNPKVGTILSWPRMQKEMGWPHNTIIDNMINLELFWAAKNGDNKKLYDIAVSHAETTMKNHFRNDYSVYHVVVYDTITGKKIKGITHQGYSDNSMWARGQAWAIYGFTMCYRETNKQEFLDFAQKVTDVYLKRLPSDHIPYWDFDAPDIPNAPKDASAAAITASALLELSQLIESQDKTKSSKYFEAAMDMINSLSSSKYHSSAKNMAFLLHSTGHKPANKEIDASIVYADYYYIEALTRLKKIQSGQSLYEPLLTASK